MLLIKILRLTNEGVVFKGLELALRSSISNGAPLSNFNIGFPMPIFPLSMKQPRLLYNNMLN